jgi:hypothetical protein
VDAPLIEPVVRIRCTLEEEPRARTALAARGLSAERSLTWLVVRDADPDLVNDALAEGGAAVRVAVRHRIGSLLGWIIDHGGQVAGREAALTRLVARVLEDGGLATRYAPRPEAALATAAAALHEHLMANGAARVSWRGFVAACCTERPGP